MQKLSKNSDTFRSLCNVCSFFTEWQSQVGGRGCYDKMISPEYAPEKYISSCKRFKPT